MTAQSVAGVVREVTLGDVVKIDHPAVLAHSIQGFVRDAGELVAGAPPSALARLVSEHSEECVNDGCDTLIPPWGERFPLDSDPDLVACTEWCRDRAEEGAGERAQAWSDELTLAAELETHGVWSTP